MSKVFLFSIFLFLFAFTPTKMLYAQDGGNEIFAGDDDDLNIGGDIFSDFNEDVESIKLVEDERFFRYGRFFSFNVGVGLTSFDGNRGLAYENHPPTLGLSFTFFKDFQSALGLGVEHSSHNMFLKDPVKGFPNLKDSNGNVVAPGYIDITQLRVFFSYRYYIDTANLGTAVTYSNPYFVTRLEYWYSTNKFKDQPTVANDVGSGIGFALGFGLEFPVELRESYIGLEFLAHMVNFHDKNTQAYAPLNPNGYGFDNLGGNVYSTMLTYVFNW